jgi:NADH-quinone oxidoreductase subunit N
VNPTDLLALLPLILLAVAVVLVMLVAAFRPSLGLAAALASLGLVAAFVAVILTAPLGSRQVTGLLLIDAYARFYTGLLVLASLAVGLLSVDYLRKRGDTGGAFYILLLLATLGAVVLVASSHFASFFLGLETLSVSLYGLVAYTADRPRSVEAGIKYLVLAAASAAFLLFGIALIYAVTGSMSFAELAGRAAATAGADPASQTILLTGQALIVVGFGFKLAVVPFHMWTPDVYEGAPAPVTGFVASVSKGAMFALLLRYFTTLGLAATPALWLVFALIAAASILAGNLLALLQNDIKRLLAYSSIANMGYLLVAFLSSGARETVSVTFYLVAYLVTILAAFGVVSVLSGVEGDAAALEDYRGLFWRHPWLAAILTVAMLSLAGIPLTAGFIGKFYILVAAGASALWWLAIILVVGSAIGLYYYLRVIVMMYLDRPQVKASAAPGGLPTAARPAVAPATVALSAASGVALAALLLGILVLGIYPTPLIGLIQTIAVP